MANKSKYLFLGSIIILIIVIILFNFKYNLFSSPKELKTKDNIELTNPVNKDEIRKNFEEAFKNRNYSLMKEMLANQVILTRDVNQADKVLPKNDVIPALSIGPPEEVYVFSQNQEIVKKIKSKYPDKFSEYTLGISIVHGQIFGYQVNNQGEVYKIYDGGSYKLIDVDF